VVTSSRHAETVASPREEDPCREKITIELTPHEGTTDKIVTGGRHGAVGRREALRNLEKQRERSSRSTPMQSPAGAGREVRGGRAGP
jgi:hypothetical protein